MMNIYVPENGLSARPHVCARSSSYIADITFVNALHFPSKGRVAQHITLYVIINKFSCLAPT